MYNAYIVLYFIFSKTISLWRKSKKQIALGRRKVGWCLDVNRRKWTFLTFSVVLCKFLIMISI